MFVTFDSGKIINPFINKGENYWSYVELALFSPFLFIKYLIESEDGGFNQMIFLRNVEELVQLNTLEKIEIKEGYLITPDFINGTNEWQMTQFTEVLKAELHGEEYQSQAIRYKFLNGQEITINSSILDVTNDTEFKSIFTFKS